MERKKTPPPDRHPKAPTLKLPPGACDCHFHIYGPQARFPLNPARHFEVEDCTLEDLLALQSALGLSRGLIVQSFQHGYSYEYLLNALCRYPDRFRGVASVAPDISDRELEILDKAGVVGIRFAPHSSPKLDMKLIRRVHELGWQAHFMIFGAEQVAAWRDDVLATPGNFVIDHMANPPVKQGFDSVEFGFLLECLDTGRGWTKLSPRFSEEETFPFADTLPFIHTLVERVPERLLWGSDWPHPGYFKPMPNDGDLIDLTLEWIPDEKTRNRIFVDNPGELFRFPPLEA